MPDADMWSAFASLPKTSNVKRVGINLGAPGDRLDDDGTLWLDYPVQKTVAAWARNQRHGGAPSPDVPVSITPRKVEWLCRHPARIRGKGLKWVAASGCKGLRSLTVTLAPGAQDVKTCTVRLHFCELEDVKPGERLFDVALQGKTVLRRFDVAKEAGGRFRTLVREFRGIAVKHDLTVHLTPAPGAKVTEPVLSGVEIRVNE